MVKMSMIYQGEKHCLLTHISSGSKIETDAPKDNQGKGERFSPTDLLGASLGSCILTTMAIVAERDGINITGATAEVEKEMVANPRRVGSLRVKVTLPQTLKTDEKTKLEETARHCPVHQSLHPDVQIPLTFEYKSY